MRVMFCLNGPDQLNGPNMWLLRHLPLLRERGAEPEVLYLTYDPEIPCAHRDRLAAQGFRVRTAPLGRFTEESVQSIVAAVDGDLPDVFVPNYSIPAHYAARFLREAGVRTVGILHSDDPYYHDLVDVFVRGPVEWRLSGVVTVSEYLTAIVSDPHGAEALPPVVHAPYGSPTPTVSASAPNGTLRLIYSGRIVEYQKRIGRVAQRLCDAADAIGSVEAIMYGRGEQEADVQAILAERSVDGRVRLGGSLGPDEVMPALVDGHVFVLLSDFEGLSIALLEAMSAGLVPIIAPFRSGAADLISHGTSGFIVDPGNRTAFVDAVRRLREDGALWQRMSAAARATIRDRGLTSEACADRWIEFCRDLMATSSTPSRQAVIDRVDTWDLPPRCTRLDGIGPHDRRTIDANIHAALKSRRPLYLWGAGSAGRVFLASRPGWRERIRGAIDSNPARQGTMWEGLPIVDPDVLEHGPGRPFVVITSQYHGDIARALEERHFMEGVDYVAA